MSADAEKVVKKQNKKRKTIHRHRQRVYIEACSLKN